MPHAADPDPPARAKATWSETALARELALPDGRALVAWRNAGEEPVTFGDLATDGEVARVVLGPDGDVGTRFMYGGGDAVAYRGTALPVSNE